LGVGGHVDEEDAQGRTSLEAYEEALRRELDEEVEIEGGGSMRRVGLINDDTTPVGQVHLGVVHLWSLSNERLSPREEGLVDAGFEEIEAVADSLTRFESWSQVCIESLLRPMLARGAGLRMS
jgi:predicted NUDIX family phosphoesterase